MKFLPSKPLINSNNNYGKIKNVKETEEGVELILTQTIFQPETSIYPGDRGTISDLELKRVFIKNNDIVHLLDKVPHEENLYLSLDTKRRFDILQQQTGILLFKIAIDRLFNSEIISYRIMEEESEIILSDFTKRETKLAQLFTNRLITSAQTIELLWEIDSNSTSYTDEGMAFISIYEMPINGFQCQNTGEVGIFLITNIIERDNNILLKFLCGERALRYIQFIMG